MSLIDVSYFIRDINIPNVTNPATLEKINSFIAKYEKECLINLFGYSIYKEIIEGTTARSVALKTGEEFTSVYGELKQWDGLVNSDKNSLIAYYVYFYIQRSNASVTTGVAVKVPKSEAATTVTPYAKMIEAWNNYIDSCTLMYYYLVSKASDFPDLDYCKVESNLEKINMFGL